MPSPTHSSKEEKFLDGLEPLTWTDCILWVGTFVHPGYGRVHAEGHSEPAHRYAWRRAFGEIPAGLVVDHVCHVPACVNVDHLRLATRQQNTQNRAGAQRNSKTGIRGVRIHDDHWAVEVQGFGSKCVYDLGEARALAAHRIALAFGDYAGRH